MGDKPVDLDAMSIEDLQKYNQDRREILKDAEALRDTVKRTYFREKDVPHSVPLTTESAKHLVEVSEAILIDAAIRKAQEEAEKFKTEQEARNQRIKEGRPLPGDVPWKVLSQRALQTPASARPTRPTYIVDQLCAAGCGATVHEIPFQPVPGRPIYCQSCYMKVLDQRRGGGGQRTVVSDQVVRDENERLKARVQELEAGGGGRKLSDKDLRKRRKDRKWRQEYVPEQ